ncbi:unnamed protein product [Blepharisma stoltei]|uniref:Polo kinase n=1 Tax=Blepharisma stoltei TaxID=1481888 RepID=A0AAU9K3E1_9CILI|nr:unnamed protein product [Blepharisma stoltei]
MALESSRNQEVSDTASIVEEKVSKVDGDIEIRRYNKGRFLGGSGFAKYYEFTNLENLKVATAKIIPKASLVKARANEWLLSEIEIHRSLHHPNIVSFEHFFEDNENVYILFELCINQTMNELLRRRKRLTELEVQCYLMQIISGMKYLHSHRVIHRGLKLGNFFLSEKMEVKIGDFGTATKLDHDGERKKTICGTPNYIAPEILDGKQGYSYEVDIWSLGIVAYTLLVGKPPFETSDVKNTYRRIRMNDYSFPDHVPLSEQSKSLITRILVNDPSKRPSIDEMLDHEFFHQGNSIPKLLPPSTLACPPSSSFLRQFQPGATNPQVYSTERLTETAPNILEQSSLVSTERISSAKEETKQLPMIANSSQGMANAPEVLVKKWVDYSSEYGLGYLLSNGSAGILFNDTTKVILGPDGHLFNYIERKMPEKQYMVANHTLTEYPKELQEKVTLLQHFIDHISYLERDIKEETGVEDENTMANPVYVKKWMRTNHAIMFRLSNKIIQVNFQDHTEIILSNKTRIVTYVNQNGERTTYPLDIAQESTNHEMTKRLKYTNDILTHMLNAPNKPDEEPSLD